MRGEKPHTIRRNIPRGWALGKPLSLYEAQRTKSCHKLVDTFCGANRPIKINTFSYAVSVGERVLTSPEIIQLAVFDGFQNNREFFDFFRKNYGEIFNGYLLFFNMGSFTPTPYALEKYGKRK